MLSLYNCCCNFTFVLFVCYVILSVLMVWICFGTKKHEVRFQKRSLCWIQMVKTLSLLPQTQLVKAYRCWTAVSSGGLVFGSRFSRLSHTFQSTLTEPQSLNVLAEPNLSGKDSTILCVAKVVYIAEFTVALHEKCTDDTVAFIVPTTFYCICFQTFPRNVTERWKSS